MFTRRQILLGSACAAALAATGGGVLQLRDGEATVKGRFAVTKTPEQWREILTPEQFAILRDADTERPWTSSHNKEKREGIFACAVDSSVKCNGLSKSDFDVFSKVGQHCLERGFITEVFAWSEIGGEEDVLQLLLIEGIDVQVAGQAMAQSRRWRSRCRPFGRTHRHHRTTSSC